MRPARNLLHVDRTGALPQFVTDRMRVLGEEFPRCNTRIAIAILDDGVSAKELTARANVIAAILHEPSLQRLNIAL
jgi:hypothetical protein